MPELNISNLSQSQLYGLFKTLGTHLRNIGYLSYAADGLYSELSASFLDQNFEKIFGECISADTRSCLGNFEDSRDKAFRWRLHILLTAAQASLQSNSVFLDLGCGSGMIASAILKVYGAEMESKLISYHMFDSFQGSVFDDLSATNKYNRDDGAFEMANSIASRYNKIAHVHPGFLPGSLIQIDPDILKRIKFISLDLNAANPEIKSMQYLIRYLSPGCIIILDDFGFPGSKEQNQRHIQFCSSHGLPLFHLPTGQGLILVGTK